MEKVIVTNSLEGNVGSCQINETVYNKSLFRVEVVAVNSCTGKIIQRNEMFDTSWLFGVPIVLILFGMSLFFLKEILE